jgi:hypothetical protein
MRMKRIAEVAQKKHIERRRLIARPGAPRTGSQPRKIPTIVIGDSPEDLEDRLQSLGSVLGLRVAGKKRWGRTALFAELLTEFRKLEASGITLPRNKSLSVEALSMGLGDALRRHGCTNLSDPVLRRDSRKRQFLANKMSRIFGDVHAAIRKYPCKDRLTIGG